MKGCLACQSIHVKQTSSYVTRLLLSIYIFLSFYFFTGSVDYGALIALIPLFIPYRFVCSDCKRYYFRMPVFRGSHNLGIRNIQDKLVLAMLPSMLTITLLVYHFPYTGLQRIVYLVGIYFINSMIIFISLYNSRKLNKTLKLLVWVLTILTTVLFSVLSYPQDSGEEILDLIFN